MPFQRAGDHRPMGRPRLVDCLKQAGAESAVVDNRLSDDQALQRRTVEHAAPLAVAAAIVAVRMFKPQQGLGLTVSGLLPQIGAGRLSSLVPDEGPRCERNPMARLLQTPADIDVVAGLEKLRIESIDRFQRFTAECHVAARNMFGHLVALEHMHRLPGGGGDASRDSAIVRRQIRSPDRVCPAALELRNEMREPMRIDEHVRIDVGHDRPARRLQSGVAGDAQSLIPLAERADVGKPRGDLRRVVGRTVVNEDHFVVGVLEPHQRLKALPERSTPVV